MRLQVCTELLLCSPRACERGRELFSSTFRNTLNLRTSGAILNVNYKQALKPVSCSTSAVSMHSFGRLVVREGKETRFLTVFKTLLKYMKLTATPMIWRRMAARVTSPRHCREAQAAMAQRGDGTQMSSEQQEKYLQRAGRVGSSSAAAAEGGSGASGSEAGGGREGGRGRRARQGRERVAASTERQVRRVPSINELPPSPNMKERNFLGGIL